MNTSTTDPIVALSQSDGSKHHRNLREWSVCIVNETSKASRQLSERMNSMHLAKETMATKSNVSCSIGNEVVCESRRFTKARKGISVLSQARMKGIEYEVNESHLKFSLDVQSQRKMQISQGDETGESQGKERTRKAEKEGQEAVSRTDNNAGMIC